MNNQTTLQDKTAAELKEMAKEAKIKNWWVLKKADLIEELEKVTPTETDIVEETVETVKEPEKEEGSKNPEPETKEELINRGEIKPEADDLITLKDIITELGIKGTKARRILRGTTIARPFNRWEWSESQHGDIIQQVKEALSK